MRGPAGGSGKPRCVVIYHDWRLDDWPLDRRAVRRRRGGLRGTATGSETANLWSSDNHLEMVPDLP
jgi:hypothetical protein